MIILNEKEYAEECLKNKSNINKPYLTLSVLAKYYYHYFGYRKKKITELLTVFMTAHYPYYLNNKLSWDETIDKIAANAGKTTLFESDGVWITKNEIETIQGIHNKVLERLAFTLLCLAKLNTQKNPKNQGWVHTNAGEIFKLARINCTVDDRYRRLGKLRELSLLEFPKKNDNLSCRITFIDNESEKVLNVYDFRELGYEYLKFIGENFSRCRDCGILFRNNKSKTRKYCSSCAVYSPKDIKTIVCIDCGCEIEVPSKNNKSRRCMSCQDKKNKEDSRRRMQKYRKTVVCYDSNF